MIEREEKIKIVIADDNQNFLEGLKAHLGLSSQFYILETFCDGKDLLNSNLLSEADLVMLDIQMTEMNGIETAKRLNDMFNDLPIIALTMHDEKAYLDELLGVGFKGFIYKPNLTNNLFEVIERVMQDEYYFPTHLKINFPERPND